MSRPININNQEEEINLKARKYRIYILGGFGINLGQFSITFKNTETNKIITSEKAFWPVQAYAFGKRAKRIFIVEIPEEGEYQVIFDNPETVEVKHSNLPIRSLFSSPLPTEKIEILITEKIEILITEKIGFFPFID